ncbi:MAG: cob(I)yrinic acid a,c-diamide adenosyltransferase [Rhodospirillaceae bacterium]
MVRLTRIYTRGGDQGKTSLGDGQRVAKHALRVEAYGTVDEANAILGLARLPLAADPVDRRLDNPGGRSPFDILKPQADRMLAVIQNDLFDLGADLCLPLPEEGQRDAEWALRITEGQVTRLETEIDQMNADLEPLNSFILPGGSEAAAQLHLARTVVRRAERMVTHLIEQEPVSEPALKYLNRLSDHLFVMARWLNKASGGDVLWVPGASREATGTES